MQQAVTNQLKVVLVEDFQHLFYEYKLHIHRCVTFWGNYNRVDKVDLLLSW